jgi:hypothetical protein
MLILGGKWIYELASIGGRLSSRDDNNFVLLHRNVTKYSEALFSASISDGQGGLKADGNVGRPYILRRLLGLYSGFSFGLSVILV